MRERDRERDIERWSGRGDRKERERERRGGGRRVGEEEERAPRQEDSNLFHSFLVKGTYDNALELRIHELFGLCCYALCTVVFYHREKIRLLE
jgi:hypothetical protein